MGSTNGYFRSYEHTDKDCIYLNTIIRYTRLELSTIYDPFSRPQNFCDLVSILNNGGLTNAIRT